MKLELYFNGRVYGKNAEGLEVNPYTHHKNKRKYSVLTLENNKKYNVCARDKLQI